MLVKTIKYTDYNGVTREEEFYFNLNKIELLEMEAKLDGGIEGYVKNLVTTRDTGGLFDFICSLVQKAYGVKSADGRKFVKNEEVLADFVGTEAYTSLMEWLILDRKDAEDLTNLTAFLNGILPKEQKQ